MREIEVTKLESGQRLDKVLMKVLNQAPTSFIYKMIRKKNITLNGKRAEGTEKLQEGDKIEVWFSDETFEKFSHVEVQNVRTKSKNKLQILYEDEHILLLNKPVGVLSQKAKPDDESMVELMIDYLLETGKLTKENLRSFHPSVCNRLDRNTSGILAAGISMAGLQQLSHLFQTREMHKYYLCLVKGKMEERQILTGYLHKDEQHNRVFVSSKANFPEDKWIETVYEPLVSNGGVTLLKVLLVTGRSHQIRAHLASVGHPLAGDEKYGDARWNQILKRKYGLSSQFLHAYCLEMPKLEGALASVSEACFEAPLPRKFEKILIGEGLEWPLGTPVG
ncbi:MAG: RluA family pseudouridine synthase [Lachnospiraceae bacterium]